MVDLDLVVVAAVAFAFRCCSCLSLLLIGFPCPIRSGGAGGSNPQGDVHGCTSCPVAAWKPRPDIPASVANPERSGGHEDGCVSFGHFSLHKQRKVTHASKKRESFAAFV
ncbi:hypothetical protein [Pseudoxanthomonas sp. JBR18]|uniref:hypothetical protein n=1 Tax=Pseudoxanthomonas sp. JBR18 TaxID=2969308 RepID=UPI0023057F46|nr:hypothetical protein [Pseudoxanthomonas sp. JBR18]WCE03447.1 hypothetical protein PJ250_15290 [Pseudoxanthomonas sp. JBR18]